MNVLNDPSPKCVNVETMIAYQKCLVCKEDILKGAKKCTKCESFQDWRRFFQFNIVVLSLLVALFSVITTSVPVIRSAILPEADVKFSFLHLNHGNIIVVATNTGRRPAVLKRVSLNMVSIPDGSKRSVPLSVRGETENKEIIINPDKWTVLALFPGSPEDAFNLIDSADYKSCQLEFHTFDLNHNSVSTKENLACDKVLQSNDG
jgi:hypothetical protein